VPTGNRTLRVGVASALSLSLAAAVAAPVVADGHIGAWEDILAEAEGQTVNWHMWSGSDQVNAYVDGYVADKAAELGITLNRVPGDAPVIVQKVLGEKEAGQDEGGSVDMIWINGENFKTAKQADLLLCDWAKALPNRQYVEETDAVNTDFGTPVDDCESPWSRAQFAFVYDSAKVPEPPSTMAELLEWIEANPGMFTYPAPPDFTGSVFVRHMLYHANGGYEDLLGEFDQAKFDEASAKTWEILNGIEPSLWRGGETYPQSKEELDNLFSNGEIAMTMTYGPGEVGGLVEDGIYPESTRTFVFDHGTIGNTNYVAIPYNAANQAGALVVADILLSPEAQLIKLDPVEGFGAAQVIDFSRTDLADEAAAIPVPESGIPDEELYANSNPELQADWLTAAEAGWQENVLQQ
jgi:putative spermidine/putrescine transport system substrate-binding protein